MSKWKKITNTTNWVKPLDRKLIELCDKAGYVAVAVCVSDEHVKDSLSFPFGPNGSIFAQPFIDEKGREKGGEIDGWPAIWRITEKMKIGSGAGNSNQHQLKFDHGLTKAAYRKVESGWEFKLDPSEISEISEKFGV